MIRSGFFCLIKRNKKSNQECIATENDIRGQNLKYGIDNASINDII